MKLSELPPYETAMLIGGMALFLLVHLYSGPKRVRAFDGLELAGEQTETKDSSPNMLDLSPHVFITAGLGISVGVDFKDGGEILFTGAGGYFQSSEQ